MRLVLTVVRHALEFHHIQDIHAWILGTRARKTHGKCIDLDIHPLFPYVWAIVTINVGLAHEACTNYMPSLCAFSIITLLLRIMVGMSDRPQNTIIFHLTFQLYTQFALIFNCTCSLYIVTSAQHN